MCGIILGLKSRPCARYASVTQLPCIVFVPVGTTRRTIYRVQEDDGDGDGKAKVPRDLPMVWIKAVTPACAGKVVDIKYSESRS